MLRPQAGRQPYQVPMAPGMAPRQRRVYRSSLLVVELDSYHNISSLGLSRLLDSHRPLDRLSPSSVPLHQQNKLMLGTD
jgi:hypothetical protein